MVLNSSGTNEERERRMENMEKSRGDIGENSEEVMVFTVSGKWVILISV